MSLINNIIPYEDLERLNKPFEEQFKKKLDSFLQKGWYILGEEVNNFETNFAQYCNSKYCIGVANGLDALELGISVLDLPHRSEIIVPSNTYIATILSIINCGHVPVLVEPDIRTYNIDADKIVENISNKTKAILVVHLYGQPAQMDKICAIAEQYKLEIIEDCAQAQGAKFNNQQVGTFGKIGAFSFYPTKNLGALGDAGAIITNDERIASKLKALRNYGSEVKYYNKYIGRNSRLDEIQAVFLNIKLQYLEAINKHKRKLAELYTNLLSEIVVKPFEIENAYSVFHIYNIRVKNRNELKKYLKENSIETEIHYPIPPHHQEGYSQLFIEKTYPLSEEIHATTLSLPISVIHSEDDIFKISQKINHFL